MNDASYATRAVERFRARDRDGAAAVIGQAVRDPGTPVATLRSLAKIAEHLGETSLRIFLSERLTDGTPPSVLAHAGLLTSLGRHEAARSLVGRLPPAVRDGPSAQHLLGLLASELGEAEGAQGHLKRALALAPGSGATWLAYAAVTDFARHPDALGSLQRAEATPDAGEDGAMRAYALGKALRDLQEDDAAFDAFARGAALVRARRSFDAAANEAALRARLREADRAPSLEAPTGPVFVLGSPRSGTTLAARLLAEAGGLWDVGEANLAPAALMPVGPGAAAATRVYAAAGGRFAALGHTYQRLAEDRAGRAGRVLDKSLGTGRWLPALARALPSARFVILRRNAADVAASAFTTYFARGLAWTFDQEWLGRQLAGEDALHDALAATYPERAVVLRYEELVTDTEEVVGRLAAWLGFEQGAKRHAAPIATASVAQARAPVTAARIGAGARYGPRLGAFEQAYGEAKRRF